MKGEANAVEISEGVFWVGALDFELRNFHGYSTEKGSSYNAFLVLGEKKKVLVDTVKKQFSKELLSRISSVIRPEEIDYVISNHSEMDHSGALPEVVEVVKPERILASKNGVKNLKGQLHWDVEVEAVDDDTSLDIGGMTLRFMETRMLHWPDSMFTYIPEKKILFSQDAFGMHYATSRLFVDENDWPTVYWESAKYYANILMPYSTLCGKLLQKIEKEGMRFDIIATDHGPLWRGEDVEKILGFYANWAARKTEKKALVFYDTMWGSTSMMAKAIAEGISAEGVMVDLYPVSSSSRADIATSALEATAMVVGSPTINNNLFPSLGDVLAYLKGLKPPTKFAAVFGSYGWSGEATRVLRELLSNMGIQVLEDEMKVKFVPGYEELETSREFGGKIGKEVKKVLGE